MNGLNTKQMRWLYYAMEINLLMWLGVSGQMWIADGDPTVRFMTTTGFILSALLQHWAYYSLFKKAREQERSANQAAEVTARRLAEPHR